VIRRRKRKRGEEGGLWGSSLKGEETSSRGVWGRPEERRSSRGWGRVISRRGRSRGKRTSPQGVKESL